MKLFESGIEIQDKEFLPESKEALESWITFMINHKISGYKDAFKNKWRTYLDLDPGVRAYPKDTDEFIQLIKSRPWFKTDEQLKEEAEKKQKLEKSSKNFRID